MTYILGVNLSDRIYLSGDTRVTRDEEIVKLKDSLVKVVPISKNIAVAAADSAQLARLIIKHLKSSEYQDIGIRELHSRINEILGPLVDNYWKETNPAAEVKLIFGGLNPGSRKKIPSRLYINRVMRFSEISGRKMNMKEILFEAIFKNGGGNLPPELELNASDSFLFSVEILPPNIFNVQPAEWGEYLAFGPAGLTRDSLPEETLGLLEFQVRAGIPANDNCIITALVAEQVESIEKEHYKFSVSPIITTVIIGDNARGLISGRIQSIDLRTGKKEFLFEITTDKKGNFWSVTRSGEKKKLVSLDTFEDFASLEI